MSQDGEDELGTLREELKQKEKEIQIKDIALKGASGLRAKLNAAEEELRKLKEGGEGGVDPQVFKDTVARSERIYEELEQQHHKNDLLLGCLLELKESHSRQEIRSLHLLETFDGLPAKPSPPTPTPTPSYLETLVTLLMDELNDSAAAHEEELHLAMCARRDETSALNFTISTFEENQRAAATELIQLSNQVEKETLRTAKAEIETKKAEQALGKHEEAAKKLITAATKKIEKLKNKCTDLEEENLRLELENARSCAAMLEKEETIKALEEKAQEAQPSNEMQGAAPEDPPEREPRECANPTLSEELQTKYDEAIIKLERAEMLLKERDNDLRTKTEEFECLQSQVLAEREARDEAGKEDLGKEADTEALQERLAQLTEENCTAVRRMEDMTAELQVSLENIRTLEAEAQEGRRALEEMRCEYTKLTQENDALKQSIQSLSTTSKQEETTMEYERCKSELQKYVEASDALRDELQQSAREVEEVRCELAKSNADLAASAAEVAACRGELEQYKEELEESRVVVEKNTNELGKNREELEKNRAELATCTQELEASKADLRRCAHDLEEFRRDLSVCTAELQSAKEELDAQSSELENKTAEVEKLKAARDAHDAAQNNAMHTLDGMRLELSTSEREREAYKQEADTLRARVAALEEDARLVPNLRTELEEKDEVVVRIQEQLASQKATAEAIQEDLQKFKDELEKKDRDMQDMTSVKDDVIQNLMAEMSSHEHAMQERVAGVEASYLAKLDAAEMSTTHSEEENRRLREDVAALRCSMDNLKQELLRARSEETAKESRRIKEMEIELLTSQKEGESLKTQLKEARAAVVAGMAETTRRMALEKKINDAEDEMKRRQEVDSAELRQQLQEARAAVAVGIADSAKLQAQLKHASQQENATLTAQLEEAQNMFHAAQRECQTLRQELLHRKEYDHELVSLQTRTNMMEEV
eukprot:TRINITY_DN3629_c0_g1_i2.p1 TRINITY_DN3629_c0_g1~~TRINITY_DN3629_c0_g1_i2.p1  ORF type:complete len:946 (+),score=350.01 TRINITY_DN3629_c0_g1_i2:46-2883(+)